MSHPVIPFSQIAQFAFEFVDPAIFVFVFVFVFVVGGGGGGGRGDRAFQHPEETAVTRYLLDVDEYAIVVTDVDAHQDAYQDSRDRRRDV